MPLNFLWFSMEDTSPRFGCYGDAVARTPNLDRLAAEGCRFPNAFCTSGVCAPSRASIITGCYATWLGAHHMRTSFGGDYARYGFSYECVPPPYVKCFTEYLRAAGYFCTNNDKTDYQFRPPVTAWDECHKNGHWRHRPAASQPFFAVFNPTLTHESGMWREGGANQGWNVPSVTDPATVSVPSWLPDMPEVRETIARHYDNIARSDEELGKLLAQLEEDGLGDNTVVMVWSDHGEGLPRAKRTPYDSGIRIPLIVRWPGHIEPNSVNEQLVSLIDLGPTLLSLAGLELPCHLQGQPFLGEQNKPREYIFAHRDRQDIAYDMRRAVRDRRFKYIRNYFPGTPHFNWEPYASKHLAMQELQRAHRTDELEGGAQALFEPRPAEELYDLDSDPHELNNVAQSSEYEETLKRLCAVLDDWRRDYDRWGDWDEWAMVETMWPNRQQPQTSSVEFIPWSQGYEAQAPKSRGELIGPVALQLQSGTFGASIAYTFDTGENPRWQLYRLPLRLPLGAVHVRAKAIRIGYKESAETVAHYSVHEAE